MKKPDEQEGKPVGRPGREIDSGTALGRLLIALVYARRGGHPVEKLAELVRASSYGDRFPNLEQWGTVDHPAHWACSTREEETVRRCGRSVHGHWRGSVWHSGPDTSVPILDSWAATENQHRIRELLG